jgi:oxalate decarboxylase/phosphoglucose isomerase-like protein (cupin superfamily)
MVLKSLRSLEEMQKVWLQPEVTGHDPVYWVFSDVWPGKWQNMTVINNGRYGREFGKTFGHYHGVDVVEKYRVLDGEGVLVLQSRGLERVVLVRMNSGQEVDIKPIWGHAWVNVGRGPLVLLDDWSEGHSGGDYSFMAERRGMAVYVVDKNGEVAIETNPNYQNVKYEWLTIEQLTEVF